MGTTKTDLHANSGIEVRRVKTEDPRASLQNRGARTHRGREVQCVQRLIAYSWRYGPEPGEGESKTWRRKSAIICAGRASAIICLGTQPSAHRVESMNVAALSPPSKNSERVRTRKHRSAKQRGTAGLGECRAIQISDGEALESSNPARLPLKTNHEQWESGKLKINRAGQEIGLAVNCSNFFPFPTRLVGSFSAMLRSSSCVVLLPFSIHAHHPSRRVTPPFGSIGQQEHPILSPDTFQTTPGC